MAKKLQARRSGTKVQFECRLSYAHLDAPWGGNGDDNKKYSTVCMIPDSDTQTIEEIGKAIDEAKAKGKTEKWKGIIPKKLREPLHSGDKESDDPNYAGMTYFSASSRDEVPVFNRLRERIDPRQAYSGYWALVEVNFYPYDVQGAGVAAGLNQVLKLRDGEQLGGGKGAADGFAGFGDELEEDEDF